MTVSLTPDHRCPTPIALWDKSRSFWDINNSLSHERGSEWSERASKQVSTAEGASEASSPEQANEWAVRANEQTDERVAQYLQLDSGLFQTTVHSASELVLPCHSHRVPKVDANKWHNPATTALIHLFTRGQECFLRQWETRQPRSTMG